MIEPTVPEDADIRARTEAAVADFVMHEADLFRRDPSERSLTHRLAIYLERHFVGWNIDCEYNRQGRRPKTIDVAAPETVSPSEDDAVTVFPDIIVHRRGPQGPNILVLETKKATSRANTAFDYVKLRAYRNQHGYRCAGFLLLPAGECLGAPIDWIAEETKRSSRATG